MLGTVKFITKTNTFREISLSIVGALSTHWVQFILETNYYDFVVICFVLDDEWIDLTISNHLALSHIILHFIVNVVP